MHVNRVFNTAVIFTIGIFMSISSSASDTDDNKRGKYLIEVAGCNDCHTTGYALNGGEIPEAQWLLGDGLGYRGPWGTTYPVNLREYIGKIGEDEWVAKARVLKTRPPMPWWALNAMTESDLREIYRYVKDLGFISNTIPSYVPAGIEPETPYILWPSPPP